MGLLAPGDDALTDERHAAVVDQAAVQAEIVPVLKAREYRRRNRADAGLDAVTVPDQRRHLLADGGGRFVDARGGHFEQRAVSVEHDIQAGLIDWRTACRSGKPGIALRENKLRAGQRRGREIGVGPQAQPPLPVPSHLDERHVDALFKVVVQRPHAHGQEVQALGVRVAQMGRHERRRHLVAGMPGSEVRLVEAR